MDTFTLAIALLLMMIAVQYNQNWMIFAIVALMILTMRSVGTTVILLIATAVIFVGKPYMEQYWPFVLFGLIILALVIGGGTKEQPQQELYSPDMLGGLGGGFGGGY
jgi:peptidoglycan/LPS O-acetylase OafA/YrhL